MCRVVSCGLSARTQTTFSTVATPRVDSGGPRVDALRLRGSLSRTPLRARCMCGKARHGSLCLHGSHMARKTLVSPAVLACHNVTHRVRPSLYCPEVSRVAHDVGPLGRGSSTGWSSPDLRQRHADTPGPAPTEELLRAYYRRRSAQAVLPQRRVPQVILFISGHGHVEELVSCRRPDGVPIGHIPTCRVWHQNRHLDSSPSVAQRDFAVVPISLAIRNLDRQPVVESQRTVLARARRDRWRPVRSGRVPKGGG